MKFLNSKNKLKLVGFIVLFTISSSSYAQGPTGTTSPGYNLASCYHILSPSNTGKTLNVLNAGSFQFNYSNNAGARPDHIRIKMYDAMHGFLGYNYHLLGIADDIFTVSQHPDHGQLIPVEGYDLIQEKWVINKNSLIFPENAAFVEITTYHWTGDAGNQTLDESTYKLTFNLIDQNDAFTINPGDKDCYTFDDFFASIIHDLDGFCGQITQAEIEAVPPVPAGSGWENPYVETIILGRNISLRQPIGSSGKPWCQQDVNTQTVPWDYPTPVPSGCITFTMRFKILPCNTAPADCPDLTVTLPITVCCSCDIRPVGPKL